MDILILNKKIFCFLFMAPLMASSINTSANENAWYLNGKSTAKVEPNNPDIKGKFHGIVVDCWKTTGTMRVWIKDLSVADNELIKYKTDKIEGSFRANKRYIAAPSPSKDKEGTKKLLIALMNGNSITFSTIGVFSKYDIDSIESGFIKAKYSLKGSTKIIGSLECTKKYMK